MANLQEKAEWSPDIYQLGVNDDVVGGPLPEGIANLQAKQLADRTTFLKERGESLVSGFSYISVQPAAVSTASVNVNLGGLIEVDGVTLQDGDIVLLKTQSDKKENGLWVAADGAWSRHPAFADGSENVFTNKMIDAQGGVVNKDKIFMLYALGDYVIGTDELEFKEIFFSAALIPGKVLIHDRNGKFKGGNDNSPGGYLTAHDFGSATPAQEELTAYALAQIDIIDPLEIWNGTKVKNINNGHLWVLTNTPETEPPIFEWADDGFDTIGQADNNATLGVVVGGTNLDEIFVDPATGKMKLPAAAQSSGLADQVDGYGRNLFDVFGITTGTTAQKLAACFAEIRRRCNNSGEIDESRVPDFRGIAVGDYIDGIDLSTIPTNQNSASNTAGQEWNDAYKNNRIVVSGFNTFKQSGDTEVLNNHILFAFRNIPLKARMNTSDTNAGGYASTVMKTFLESTFAPALKAQLAGGGGEDYILSIRKLLSTKGGWSWGTFSVWLPSEEELFGCSSWGEKDHSDGVKVHLPIYQKTSHYRCKRYNGARDWHWESSPYSGSAASFCGVSSYGYANGCNASSVGGCAPAFCVA